MEITALALLNSLTSDKGNCTSTDNRKIHASCSTSFLAANVRPGRLKVSRGKQN
jgi:hypothetical protein